MYVHLPKTWKNHLNFTMASEELQKLEGFFDVVKPEYDIVMKELGQIYFDETNQVFTYPVVDRAFDLEELKSNLMAEFDVVLNEFAVIISRCRLVNDPEPQGLLDAIEQARVTRRATLMAINNLSTIEEALAFHIKQEDVDAFKELFKP
jgi:hypothetical protein